MSDYVPSGVLLEPSEDFQLWRVASTFTLRSTVLKMDLIIPENFVTDLASIPRWLWWLLSPSDKYAKGAIGHDYLYRWQRTTRHQADDALLEWMLDAQCSPWQWLAIWAFVRMFGGIAWRKDKSRPLSSMESSVNQFP